MELSRMAAKAPPWALLVGVTVAGVYLLLLPWVARTWQPTGDEPHYLLAAHSLVVDHDFDLANNYANFDYLNFYPAKDIAPQIRFNAVGQQILDHYPALPVIIAPAYALGGRFGVLLFQSILAGGLAALTFKLAGHVSGHLTGSLLATLLIAFSPPLLMYPYLVYPELIAALLTTMVLYLLLANSAKLTTATAPPTPQRGEQSGGIPPFGGLGGLNLPVGLTGLTLVLLPWLNRRFVPLALVLALLTVWFWRERRRVSPSGLAVLTLTGLSIAGLAWYTSQLNAPIQPDITAPYSGDEAWSRLLRSVGWLLDQQRGLFIFAPLYLLTLWGLPDLLVKSRRNWLVGLPFLLSLATAGAAGGYWVAWELGPRFLVVGLPGLAPLPALAWQRFHRRPLWLAFALLLVLVSLINSWMIMRNPQTVYTSTLPLMYGERLGLPLTELLPDMGGYAGIPAPALPVKSEPLTQLPFGHYRLTWPVKFPPNLPADTPLARLTITALGGGLIHQHLITPAEVTTTGTSGLFQTDVFNPNPNRWQTPMLLHLVSLNPATISAGNLLFSPQPGYALFLPYLLLAFFAATAGAAWYLSPPLPRSPAPLLLCPPAPRSSLWLLLVITISASYLLFSQTRVTYSYSAADLSHFVGRPTEGQTWTVDPAIDPPQKAIYGPFEYFDAGEYRVTFRLKLLQAVTSPQEEVARLQVSATTNFEPLLSQPLRAENFSQPNQYHDMVLTVANPRRQALSFEVYYPGLAPLTIERVTIGPLPLAAP
jgi:hypothetical protein